MIKRKLGHREISCLGTGGFCLVRFLAVIAISLASARVAAAQNNLPPSEQTQIIEKLARLRWGNVQVIDVFGYPRSDYLLKMMQKMAEMNTKK